MSQNYFSNFGHFLVFIGYFGHFLNLIIIKDFFWRRGGGDHFGAFEGGCFKCSRYFGQFEGNLLILEF